MEQLSDHELGELFEVVFDEVKRRGQTAAKRSLAALQRPSELLTKTSPATHKPGRRKADITEVTLTRGQVNAVCAAFKAGITPSRIDRQFGISQSNVRKALAGDDTWTVNDMTITARLTELDRQHKALEVELAAALAHSSSDDLKVAELRRRRLLKDEIERLRHDHEL